jgi:SnoaL-like domain
MSSDTAVNHLPGDPEEWVRKIERVYQTGDGQAASQGYDDGAVLTYGADQQQSGAPLRERGAKWFAYAQDLKITKKYIAHSNDTIVTTWDSVYTNPETGEKVCERGIEYFVFRNGKVHEQQAWQHSWPQGHKPADKGISTD